MEIFSILPKMGETLCIVFNILILKFNQFKFFLKKIMAAVGPWQPNFDGGGLGRPMAAWLVARFVPPCSIWTGQPCSVISRIYPFFNCYNQIA